MGASLIILKDSESLFEKLRGLGKRNVYVGFPAGSGGYEDGVTVAQVAAWNEFGTRNMPSRPFMRDTVNLNKAEVKRTFDEAAKAILNGSTEDRELEKIGVLAKAMMQKQITDGGYAPDAPSTVRKKGSSHPLIDTGQMRQSVNYVIR